MNPLDRSIDKLIQRIDRLDPSNSINSDGIACWKGRKIIPLQDWFKISKANTLQGQDHYNVKEAIDFFPDDYVKCIFLLGVPDDVKEDANKWYAEYLELMEHRKNPSFGKTKCFNCILSPDRGSQSLCGIHKAMARALYAQKAGGERKEHLDDKTISDESFYPCRVVNIFACPYNKPKKEDEDFDTNDLFYLQEVAHIIEHAFSVAYLMTKSNELTYETDFETKKVKEIHTNYYGDPWISSVDYELEDKLKEVEPLSAVPIRNEEDVYNALTNKEILNKLLQQGLGEKHQINKDEILEFLMSLAKYVKMEDLRVGERIFTSNKPKGNCSICQGFTNIHCMNCQNVWLCIDHWKEHEFNKHTG